MGSDPQYAKFPNLSFAQDIFALTNSSSPESSKQVSLKKLQDGISEHKMAPLYRHLAHPVDGVLNSPGEGSARRPSGGALRRPNGASTIVSRRRSASSPNLPWDEKLYEKLKVENEEELKAIEKEEEESAEKAGETEVQAAKGKRAEFYARIGDKVGPIYAVGSAKIT